jgi:hypothetical protein
VLNARALRASKIGCAGPRMTPRQEERLAQLRNAIEYSEEKLQGKHFGKSPPFGKPEPYCVFSGRLGVVSSVPSATMMRCSS